MANNKRVISNTKTKCKIGDFLTLSSEESHHLLNVLRLKIDNLVEVLLDNSGQCFLAKITKDKVIAEIEILEEIKTKQPKNIHLIVALIKPTLCELIVEKCTELGVSSIIFFQATHHREGAIYNEKKITRLNKIRDAALKQSKSFVKTEIRISPNLELSISPFTKTKGIYLSVEQAPNIIEVLTSETPTLEKLSNFDDLYLVVGPEGGLTKEEIEIVNAAGARAVSLGKNILKTETASIVSASIAMCFAW